MSEINSSDRYEGTQGHSIRYYVGGDQGETKVAPISKLGVLFFHGFSFSLDDWKKTGTFDRISTAGYPAFIALDLPSGKSSKSDKFNFQSVSECIPVIDEFLEKVGFFAEKDSRKRRQTVIIGPSMGGGFALAYAIAHQDKVAGLVLISPSLKSIADEDLENLQTPTLLVWGEKDNVFPLEEHGRQLKNKLPHAKLIIIKGAGHAAYLDKPEEFNDLLVDFLEEIS